MPIRLRYPELAPGGYAALSAFGHYVNTATTLSPVLLGLVYLRASHLNGCAFCVGMHSAELRKINEPQTRIDAVKDWQSSDVFTPRERAALRWTDVLTQLPGNHAADEDYAAVNEFFKDKDLADLTFAIANINAWNRMGVAFRPVWHEGGPNKHAETPAPAKEAAPTEAETSTIADDGGKVAED